MAVYTHVSALDLEVFLSAYDIGVATSLKGIAEGVENSNYFLETSAGRYILTLYEKRTAPGDLPYYLDIMGILAQKGLPCPLPITDKSGQALKKLNGKMACIISFLKGVSTDTPTAAHCQSVGVALAQMHSSLSDFAKQKDNPLTLPAWQDLFHKNKKRADEIQPGLSAMIEKELTFLSAHWPKGLDLPMGTIHADLFPDNVLFTDTAVSGLIDFYFSCYDYLAYDLAVCITAWCFDSQHIFQPHLAEGLIKGYQSIRPLTNDEKTALPFFCRGACMRFLLTRLNDWFADTPGAVVNKKNPLDYMQKLTAFQQGHLLND